MPSRVTINDLAFIAGVSNATVSMALRDHPKISLKRRSSIKKLAAKMGYRPDPNLAMIASRRWNSSKTATGITIAYIGRFRQKPMTIDRFAGATRRLEALGYQLEYFPFEKRTDPVHFNRMLHSRGIRGIIWDLPVNGPEFAAMRWERFTVVGMGSSSEDIRLLSVQEDAFMSSECACEIVAAQGYRQPGLIIFTEAKDQRPDLVEGAYWVAARKFQWKRRIPPLFLNGTYAEGDLAAWLRREKPDVVLSMTSRPLEIIRKLGVRVPEDVGFACLHIWPSDASISGVDPLLQYQGEMAATFLHASMLEGQWGLPKQVHVVEIKGNWQDGETLRS